MPIPIIEHPKPASDEQKKVAYQAGYDASKDSKIKWPPSDALWREMIYTQGLKREDVNPAWISGYEKYEEQFIAKIMKLYYPES